MFTNRSTLFNTPFYRKALDSIGQWWDAFNKVSGETKVVQMLASMKIRLLAKVAPWYIEHDDLLKPIIEEYL